MTRVASILLALSAFTLIAVAQQQPQPMPTTMPPAIATPVDKPYPTPIQL
jgi:hypothetical protein